ncbi:MAG: Hsp70 family protein [Planctomycetes bacterium]|nr:Hsp70 family protein [Planctomycetota bacterium]
MTTPQARTSRSVGIDLGTTYSALAYLNDKLIPMVAPVGDGSPVMPSAVFFDDEDVVVGQFALQQSKAMADRLVQYIKGKIGQRWRGTFQGIEHTPETISAIILGELLKRAGTKTGRIESAVITVPACFTERQRKSTQQAGELAKLKVLGTLNEPMAAALMFGRMFQLDAEKDTALRTDKPQHIAVYDLGGGTFDVTIIRVTPDAMQELTTNGDRQLGGRDWDQCLFTHVADEWKRRYSVDVSSDPQAAQDLILACERAKRELGEQSHVEIRTAVAGRECVFDITRDTFESLTAHLVESTRLTLESTMSDAGLTWQTLDRVVLVGGSTFLPTVRRMLEQAHGRKPDTRVHPMTAVAQGAALYAHLLETGAAHREFIQLVGHDPVPCQPPPPPVVKILGTVPPEVPRIGTPAQSRASSTSNETMPPAVATVPAGSVARTELGNDTSASNSANSSSAKSPGNLTNVSMPPEPPTPQVTFVTASGFGVAVTNAGESKNTVLIPKNTPVPTERSKTFYTAAVTDEHTVIPINVTQGDSANVQLIEQLGTVLIEGLPHGEPAGQPVQVTIQLDVQGRLHVQAVYSNTGQRVRTTLEVAGCLRPEEMQMHRAALAQKGLVDE